MKNLSQAVVAVPVVLILHVAVSAQELPEMPILIDSLDGRQEDITGPSDITQFNPLTRRIWIAQGRRRMALRPSDQELQFDEKRDFDSPYVANEMDDENDRLFNLSQLETKADPVIYPVILMEETLNPDAPQELDSIILDSTTLPAGMSVNELVTNLRVYPPDRKLVVVREQSLLVVDYGDLATLSIVGAVQMPSAYALFAQTAEGGFYWWPIDSMTRNPTGAGGFVPGVWPGPAEGWEAGDDKFGTDIAFAVNPANGHKIILLDYSNQSDDEIAIHCADVTNIATTPPSWAMPIVFDDPNIRPNVADITVDGTLLFVAAHGGFFVIDLVQWDVVPNSAAYTNPGICGNASFDRVEGIEHFTDQLGNQRIFVSLTQSGPDPTGAIAMYDFVPGAPPTLQECLFESDFPGVELEGGSRMDLFETSPGQKARLYVGTQNGGLLEIEYDAATDGMTPIAHGSNGGFFKHVTDVKAYPLGMPVGMAGPIPSLDLRIFVGKFVESFTEYAPHGSQ